MAPRRQPSDRHSLQPTPSGQSILPTTEEVPEFNAQEHAKAQDLNDGLTTLADAGFIPTEDADYDEEDDSRGSALHNDGYSPVNLTSGTCLDRKWPWTFRIANLGKGILFLTKVFPLQHGSSSRRPSITRRTTRTEMPYTTSRPASQWITATLAEVVRGQQGWTIV